MIKASVLFVSAVFWATSSFATTTKTVRGKPKYNYNTVPYSAIHTVNGVKVKSLNKRPVRNTCTETQQATDWAFHDTRIDDLTGYDPVSDTTSGLEFYSKETIYGEEGGALSHNYRYTHFTQVTGQPVYWYPPGGIEIWICMLPGDKPPEKDEPKEPKCPGEKQGSIIKVDNQVLGETIPLVGTGFDLVYMTDRDVGRILGQQATIPLKYSWTSPTATSLHLDVTYDGQTDTLDFSVPDLEKFDYTYTWNGKNRSGVYVPHMPIKFKVRQDPSGSERPEEGEHYLILSRFDARNIGLGGWMITPHHYFNVATNKLYKGDGDTQVVEYRTISGGDLLVVDPSGSEYYIFDQYGKHLETRTTLLDSLIYSFAYDLSGRLSTITDAYSKVTTINRNMGGALTGITSPYSQTTSLTLNGVGRLVEVTNPKSETYYMEYHQSGSGLLKSFEKPAGQVSKFFYDGSGRLTKDERVGGLTSTLSFLGNPNEGIVRFTSKAGTQTDYEVRSVGTVVAPVSKRSGTTSDGVEQTYKEYADTMITSSGHIGEFKTLSSDPRFDTIKYTSENKINDSAQDYFHYYNRTSNHTGGDPFNYTTLTNSHTYDSNTETSVFTKSTKTWTNTSFEGRVSTRVLDAKERTVEVDGPASAATQFTYNSNGKLTSTTQGSRTTAYTYLSSGFLETVTNSLSQVTTYAYDLAGNNTKITLPDSREINYTYDGNGKLLTVQPPGKDAYYYNYGKATELLASLLPPAVNSNYNTGIHYYYNDDGVLSKVQRPDGSQLTYTYYSNSTKLSSISDGTNSFNFYGYDPNGLPTETSSPDGIVNEYTRRGPMLLSNQLWIDGGSEYVGKLVMTYDDLRLASITIKDDADATIGSWNYTYDLDSILETAGDLTYSVNATTGLTDAITIGSLSESLTYSSTYGEFNGYTVSYSGSTKYSYSLTRDLLGRITQMSENVLGTTAIYDYTYDTAGRLDEVEVNSTLASENTYDSNSNRTSGQVRGTAFTATYDAHDRLSTWNNYQFGYDKNGERTSKLDTSTSDQTNYSWDAWGKLKSVTLPNSDVVSYKYDGSNRKSELLINGSVEEAYIYTDQIKVAAKVDSSGNFTQVIWGSKANSPDYIVKGGNKYRLVTDPRGSIRLVVKIDDGTVAQRMDYDEWGRVTSDTNPGFQPFGFAGGLYDYRTGLVQFGARHYDGETGRWLSKDPIGFAGGDTNLYGYVMQDPINLVDPMGLWAWPWDIYNDAAQEAADKYVNDKDSSKRQDAYRHCLASCMNTRENGALSTVVMGNAYEVAGTLRGQPLCEGKRDINNNNMGIDAAKTADNCSAKCSDYVNRDVVK